MTVLCPTDNSGFQMTADAIKYNNDTALSNQYIYDNDGNLVRQKNHQRNTGNRPLCCKKDVRKVITMKKILDYLVSVGFVKW